MSTVALQARIAALQASAQPTPPPADPVVLTSVLNSKLALKASQADLVGLAVDVMSAIDDVTRTGVALSSKDDIVALVTAALNGKDNS